MPDLRKNYVVGPWGGEECCYCCDRCNTETPAHYNNCTGCPPLCCTCPPICDLEVTITATCCAGMNNKIITLKKATWTDFPTHYCVAENPRAFNNSLEFCYDIVHDPLGCPYHGDQHPYEKWANKTGSAWGECMCGGTPDKDSNNGGVVCAVPGGNPIVCDGVWQTYSLCCCDSQTAGIVNADPYDGECKTCSYQFRTEWSLCPGVPIVGTDVCSCYDGQGGPGLPTEGLPPDPDPVNGHTNGLSMIWEHVAGDCGFSEPYDPMNWRMEYKLGDVDNPLYWNCDCCFNTEFIDIGIPGMNYVRPIKAVYFTAVIVPVAGCVKGGP